MATDVGILNINSYTGVGLATLIAAHPELRLAAVAGHSSAGKTMRQLFPFWDGPDLPVLETLPPVDLVFSALPHAAAAEAIAPLARDGVRVIDLSADFRLRDPAIYAAWYEHEHPAPDLLPQAVYGLTELWREEIGVAALVANPGCYPTATSLGLAPLLATRMLSADAPVIVDAKSGVSGAGRSLKVGNLFCEVDESVAAYGLDGHRHLPEIQQTVEALAGGSTGPVVFVPHLIPMTRGILATLYLQPRGKIEAAELRSLYRDYYRNSPCVRISDTAPATKWTAHTNLCVIHPTVDARSGQVIVVSCIDNLVKGAAGQAIQNANVMLGLPEETGLPLRTEWP